MITTASRQLHAISCTRALRVGTRRVLLVAMMVLGLLVSLVHCAEDGFAKSGGPVSDISYVMSGATDDASHDHLLPAHGNHCLSHISQGVVITFSQPEPLAHMRLIRRDYVSYTRDPAPLFKPPRI